jgi:DNA gyrase subunit A
LHAIIPAPDFPTGGLIYGTEGSRTFSLTGHGSIVIQAKTHIEQLVSPSTKHTRSAIVVTEVPYMTNKAGLCYYSFALNLLCVLLFGFFG